MSLLAVALLLSIGGVVAVFLLSRARTSALEASRRRLAALALDAEAREQRRVSEYLHDTALQTMAATKQDLDEALRGDRESLQRAATGLASAISEVRQTVSALHPAVTEHAGVGAALRAVALDHARRNGFSLTIEIERETSGVDDRVLLFLARELISNAAAHAHARHVAIRLVREDRAIVLEVSDDGVGFDDGARARALRNGHIGLAACKERVEALGGGFALSTAPGAGTHARVTVPVNHERRRFARVEEPAGSRLPALR